MTVLAVVALVVAVTALLISLCAMRRANDAHRAASRRSYASVTPLYTSLIRPNRLNRTK